MIPIIGLRNTNLEFIEKIDKISKEKEKTSGFIDNLKKLNIFSAIVETDKGISVSEEKRSIKFKGDTVGNKPRGYLGLKLPNLFGRGENLEFSFSTEKDQNLSFVKPILCNNISFLGFEYTKDKKKMPEEDLPHKSIFLSFLNDQGKFVLGEEFIGNDQQIYTEIEKTHSPFTLKIKTGLHNSAMKDFFCKTELRLKQIINLTPTLFTGLSLSYGTIIGNPHKSERFFLGENIRGYKNMSISPKEMGKRVGGKSFIEAITKFGINAFDSKLFIFGSLGYTSVGNNLKDTVREATKACLSSCSSSLGVSIGLGIDVPVLKNKNGPTVNLSLSTPLTKNENTQKLQFGFNCDF